MGSICKQRHLKCTHPSKEGRGRPTCSPYTWLWCSIYSAELQQADLFQSRDAEAEVALLSQGKFYKCNWITLEMFIYRKGFPWKSLQNGLDRDTNPDTHPPVTSSRCWRICPTPNWIPAQLSHPPVSQLDDGWMDCTLCPHHHCPPRAPDPPKLLSRNPSASRHHGLAHTGREKHLAGRAKGITHRVVPQHLQAALV